MHAVCSGLAALFVAVNAIHARAGAQDSVVRGTRATPGAATLSPQAIADSLAVRKRLRDAIKADATTRKDAATWYRLGMLTWSLAQRGQTPPPDKRLDWTQLLEEADTSLRMASHLDRTNPLYTLALAKLLVTSGSVFARIAAPDFFSQTVQIARASPDTALRVSALIETGYAHWLMHEVLAQRLMPGDSMPPTSLTQAAGEGGSVQTAANTAHNALINVQTINQGGENDYTKAEDFVSEAYGLAPDSARAFRLLAMVYADRDRWRDLRGLAEQRTRRSPRDPLGWMTLGLALHRTGSSDHAAAKFDTALALVDAKERARLTAFQRILRPLDTLAHLRMAREQRVEAEETFWDWADPLWSQVGNDARTEFLARVAFAELRWSIPDENLRGADTDRGNVYIRYGPPDRMRVVRPPPPGKDRAAAQPLNDYVYSWDYNIGLHFVFWGPPMRGTARVPPVDEDIFDEQLNRRPWAFTNLLAGSFPLAVRTARFRAPGDSVDLLIATRAPVAEMRKQTAGNARVKADFWMYGRGLPMEFRDSWIFDSTGARSWTSRLEQTNYMYRIEATIDGSAIAGQTTQWIEVGPDSIAGGFAMRGLGLSDILLATRAEPRVPIPRRWTDYDAMPLIGDARTGSELAMVWENYEFGANNGRAVYDVSVTLQREGSAAGRVGATITSAIAGVIGVNRGTNNVTATFTRTVSHAPILVDKVSLILTDTPAGRYKLTLTVRDRASGRSTVRTTPLVIAR